MRVTNVHKSSVAAVVVLLTGFAAAHPHNRIHAKGCESVESGQIASTISCGQPEDIRACIGHVGSDASYLETCLLEAGCGPDEAEAEAAWAAEKCSDNRESQSEEEYVVIELREVQARADTTTTTSTTSSSSSSSTTTSSSTSSTSSSSSTTTSTTTDSSSSSTSTSTSSGTGTSTSASSTATSSTASSTSSSTASSTSSSSSATSTSSASSPPTGMTRVGVFVAVLLALFAAGCTGFICFSCCQDRAMRKKAARAAEAKQALIG